jgi:hypothetical protein
MDINGVIILIIQLLIHERGYEGRDELGYGLEVGGIEGWRVG